MMPVQGASAALDHAHTAKTLSALNPCLTNECAAAFGFTLVLADSFISGMASAFTSNKKTPQAATEKAFQNQVDALLDRYSLTEKSLDPSQKADSLPPALITHGHQFLSDAFALSESYEKSHASAKSRTIGSQMNGSDLPTSSQCTFKVLSPTQVKIVPRVNPKSPFEARLEDGQWRIDMGSLTDNSAPSKSEKTITPQAAAFLKAIDDNDAAAVEQKLKADPALANLPPARDKENSIIVSDLPLSKAAFPNDFPVVTLLLKAGAKVNAENYFGETALDRVAFFGGADMVTLLLARGADVAHRDEFGDTALHKAAEGNHPDIIAVLLAHGAEVNARDDEGKTPLTVALASNETDLDHAAVINLLRRHGAKQ